MNVDKEKDEKEIIMLKGALKEKARCISDLTYLVEDVSVLQKALDSLEDVAKAMDAACIKQEGLPIPQSPRKQKSKVETWKRGIPQSFSFQVTSSQTIETGNRIQVKQGFPKRN